MNRVDFGHLIAALRKEHEDEDLKPWTQEKLAEEANLAAGVELFTRDVIANIERGKRSVDHQALQALATALRLTSGERKEFFLASSGIESEGIPRQENTPEEVFSELLDTLKQMYLPASLLDAYGDNLAVNQALIDLLDVASCGWDLGSQIKKPFPHNHMRFLFSEEVAHHFEQQMGANWPNYAYTGMMIFRERSLRYRATEYFQDLLRELKKSHLFKRYWREVHYYEKDLRFNAADMRLNSPKWGPIKCFPALRIAITTAGELYLSVMIPADYDTANTFTQISNQIGAPIAYQLSSWPEKKVLQEIRDIRIIV